MVLSDLLKNVTFRICKKSSSDQIENLKQGEISKNTLRNQISSHSMQQFNRYGFPEVVQFFTLGTVCHMKWQRRCHISILMNHWTWDLVIMCHFYTFIFTLKRSANVLWVLLIFFLWQFLSFSVILYYLREMKMMIICFFSDQWSSCECHLQLICTQWTTEHRTLTISSSSVRPYLPVCKFVYMLF